MALTPAQLAQINPSFATLLQNVQRTSQKYPLNPPPSATSTTVAGTRGAVGPGGARFGMGAGGPNRFDHTQYGGGLWSIGIDPSASDVDARVQQWFDSQPANVQAEVRKGLAGGKSLTWAADWRARDVARKIKKTNGFMDSTLGKIIGTVAPIAVGFIPGIGTAAQIGLGAALGGARGGVKGALLGAAASAVGPSIKLPGGISAAVRAPVTAVKSVATQFANPTAMARLAASRGFGAAMPQRRA